MVAWMAANGDKISLGTSCFTQLYMTNVTYIYDICTPSYGDAYVIVGMPGSVLPAFIPVVTSLGA